MFEQIKSENNQGLNEISLSSLSGSVRRELSRFHEEEFGASGSIDNIMLVMIGALILVALATFVNTSVWAKVKTNIQQLIGINYG